MKLDLGAGAISPEGYKPIDDDFEWFGFPRLLEPVCGIYCIYNIVNERAYVGSSCNVRTRCIGHRSQLVHGKHANWCISEDWKKYGSNAFEWALLETVYDEDLLEDVETLHIAAMSSCHDEGGYNLISNPRRRIPAAISRLNRSLARKGCPAWNKGIPVPEHVKSAISLTLTGRQKSADTCEKLRLAMLGPAHPFRGKRHPADHCHRISLKKQSLGPLSGNFKGVYLDQRTNTFMARLYFEGKQYFLGRYKIEEEAAVAYNAFALKCYGPECYLNDVSSSIIPVRETKRGRPQKAAAI